MVWSIILHWQVHYHLKDLMSELQQTNLEKTLLAWCRTHTQVRTLSEKVAFFKVFLIKSGLQRPSQGLHRLIPNRNLKYNFVELVESNSFN